MKPRIDLNLSLLGHRTVLITWEWVRIWIRKSSTDVCKSVCCLSLSGIHDVPFFSFTPAQTVFIFYLILDCAGSCFCQRGIFMMHAGVMNYVWACCELWSIRMIMKWTRRCTTTFTRMLMMMTSHERHYHHYAYIVAHKPLSWHRLQTMYSNEAK